MAQIDPEVVPEVSSMPSEGWYCATSGKARKRVTSNSGSNTHAIYRVQGVPGYTHNSSAVMSVDADYTKRRTTGVNVGANIWGPAGINLAEGELVDSDVIDNEKERFDRAIERCVGSIALRPENCTGHIIEPTRSIAEIRTLIAPKTRLDTLTYVEEKGGWRVPTDAQGNSVALHSSFPSIKIDMRPLTAIQLATVNPDVTVSSLFMKGTTYDYRIVAGADGFTIGSAGGQPWDGTLEFVWDDDQKLYSTLRPFTVVMNEVRVMQQDGTALDDGQHPRIYDIQDGGALNDNHGHRLTVTFPVIKTQPATDGFCWLADDSADIETVVQQASRVTGKLICPKLAVDVLGITEELGPFKWIGMPAYRIPVGGSYAFPCSDILLEQFGDGTANDFQYNFWDRLDSFTRCTGAGTMDGFLRFGFRRAAAEALQGNLAPAVAQRSVATTFNIHARAAQANNGGMFQRRAAGVLHDVGSAYDAVQPNFTAALVTPLLTMYPGGADVVLEAQVEIPMLPAYQQLLPDGHDPLDGAGAHPDQIFQPLQLTGTSTFAISAAAAAVPPAVGPLFDAATTNQYVFVPLALQYHRYATNIETHAYTDANEESTNSVIVPCKIVAKTNRQVTYSYDLRVANTRLFVCNQGAQPFNAGYGPAQTGANEPIFTYTRGWSVASEDDWDCANIAVGHQNNAARNTFMKSNFGFGNRYALAQYEFDIKYRAAANGNPRREYIVFTKLHIPKDIPFIYFRDHNGRLHYAEHDHTRINTSQDNAGKFIEQEFGPIFIWDQDNQCRLLDSTADPGVPLDQDIQVFLPHVDWLDRQQPPAVFRADAMSRGAVFQSIKRISQHICAPVLNPNKRIGCTAPLDYDSRHLPPEMRDFRLDLYDFDWSRLRSQNVTINDLVLYQFKDGSQTVGAEDHVLYLPEFRETTFDVVSGSFELTVFSELGAPSYFCFFCRGSTTDILQQPIIQTLSIKCETTKKKSNVVYDMDVGQMYHLTQRNVHPLAQYDRTAFRRRQTVLLKTEDIGMLGLTAFEYQKAKRVNYTFSGSVDRNGKLYVVMCYNNRGLHVRGRHLHLVSLHQ